MDFIRDDDYMQAWIADLMKWFNEELLYKAVTEQAAKSKIAMEDVSIFFDSFNDTDDNMFEYSATRADTPKGITE